jgi:drug/metabolite transporter (DMT)-like permease
MRPNSVARQEIDAQSWLMLAALSLLWGASFLFIKIAATDIPIFSLVFLRVALAALVLHLFVIATGRAYPADRNILRLYLLMGLLNNAIPFVLIVYATPRIGAGAAGILNAMTPVFTLLIAHWLTADEKITARKATGVLIGFAGVTVMIGPMALGGLGAALLASFAMLGATVSYGFSAIVGKSFRGIDPAVSSACQLTASSGLVLPLALAVDRPWALPMPGTAAIWATVGFAILSTALAYILFFRIISRAGGTNVMLVTLLIPPSAVLLGMVFLNERLAVSELAGMVLISAGLLVIDGRPVRWLQARFRTA